jgi:hypothetical protein
VLLVRGSLFPFSALDGAQAASAQLLLSRPRPTVTMRYHHLATFYTIPLLFVFATSGTRPHTPSSVLRGALASVLLPCHEPHSSSCVRFTPRHRNVNAPRYVCFPHGCVRAQSAAPALVGAHLFLMHPQRNHPHGDLHWNVWTSRIAPAPPHRTITAAPSVHPYIIFASTLPSPHCS